MLFKELIIEGETKKTALEVVELYEKIIRLRTEARLKGLKPPFDNLATILAKYIMANRLETKF